MHSTVTDTDRLACVTAGKYPVLANVTWEAHATGLRRITLFRSVAGVATEQFRDTTLTVGATTETTNGIACFVSLAAGDYLYLEGTHTNGSTLFVVTPCSFSMTWIAP